MEIVKFTDPKVEEFLTTALGRRNLIPIVGSGFTKGATARNGKVPAYSAASRPPIPIEAGHPFRLKSATYSD